METLNVSNVSLTYPGLYSDQAVIALKGVNLEIKSGDFVVALGASGCGKTTLLNLMAGFMRRATGKSCWETAASPAPAPTVASSSRSMRCSRGSTSSTIPSSD
ncbi:hypothetical protein T190_24875 [Sinorhizobium meliloti CCBAU 01290]|nr:hypothetical protein T190_24875 [Sinorhizobium meliloti CCBAU 01290]